MAKSKRTRFASDPNALLATLVGVEVAVIVLLPVDTELLAYTPVEVGDTVVRLVEIDLPTAEVEDTVVLVAVLVAVVPLTSAE
jgi:hypothetical protein